MHVHEGIKNKNNKLIYIQKKIVILRFCNFILNCKSRNMEIKEKVLETLKKADQALRSGDIIKL